MKQMIIRYLMLNWYLRFEMLRQRRSLLKWSAKMKQWCSQHRQALQMSLLTSATDIEHVNASWSSVFKISRVDLEQLTQGLECPSLITFLTLSKACIKFVFSVQSEVELTKEDFLSLIDKHWLDSLSVNQRMTMDWFLQYVNEVNQGDAGTVRLMVHILCANTFLLLLGKWLTYCY